MARDQRPRLAHVFQPAEPSAEANANSSGPVVLAFSSSASSLSWAAYSVLRSSLRAARIVDITLQRPADVGEDRHFQAILVGRENC